MASEVEADSAVERTEKGAAGNHEAKAHGVENGQSADDSGQGAARKQMTIKPPEAQEHFERAQELLEVTGSELVVDPVLGIVPGEVPAQRGAALEELRAALNLAPHHPLLRLKLGQLLCSMGAAASGVIYMEEAVAKKPRATWLRALGAVYASGQLEDFERSLTAYERAYQLDPLDTKNAAAIAEVGPKATLEWRRIWKAAARVETVKKSSIYRKSTPRELMDKLFSPSADHRTVNALRGEIESAAEEGTLLHPSVLELVALRIQFLGYLTSGSRLFDSLAQRQADRVLRSTVHDMGKLQRAMSALVSLENYGHALTLSDPFLADGELDDRTRAGYQKLHSDAHLLIGDAEPLLSYADQTRSTDLPYESAFASLVSNRRVAVLGGEIDALPAAQLQDYDLVVHIGEPPEDLLSQVDVVYLTGAPLRSAAERLERSVDRGELELVVGSGADFNPSDQSARWLRIPQQEYSLSFKGRPTELQRSLYDLIQFQPEALYVMGSDLHVTQFADAGRQPRPAAPGDVTHSLLVHHDVSATFKFIKSLYEADLISVDEGLEAVLSLETDAYLKRLTEQNAFAKKQREAFEVPDLKGQLLLNEARKLLEAEHADIISDPVLGLTRGSDRVYEDEALEKLKEALETTPGDPVLLFEIGKLTFEKGEGEDGLAFMETAVAKRPNSDWFFAIGAAYRRPHVAHFDKALSAYERAFQLNTKDSRALAGILNIGARGTMDWPRLWRHARSLELKNNQSPYQDEEFRQHLDQVFMGTASSEEVGHTLRAIETKAMQDRYLHRSVMGFVATRLQFMGHLSAGYDLRAEIAQKDTVGAATDLQSLRRLLKATVYVDDFEQAAALSNPRFWPEKDSALQRKHEKFHAEAHLLLGDVERYLEYSARVRQLSPLRGDNTMEELVRDKRVAIVGPVDSGDKLGKVIDEFDVIVRPRFVPTFVAQYPEAMGSRTDVVYINGQDIQSDIPEMAEAVEEGSLQLAVARPLSYRQNRHRDLPWLRFYRQDFGLHFHGFALGMQRFAYDILQFAPAEIGIFNSDMYTSGDAFAEGYRPDKDQGFGPGSIMNDLIVNHDLKFDFKYMQALQRTGIVRAYGIVEEVLSLTSGEYVAALESRGALR